MSDLLPDLGAAITKTEAVYSRDLLRALLDGRSFIIGAQIVRAADTSRIIMREKGFSTRPTKLWDES
jgi:hypothetical protein